MVEQTQQDPDLIEMKDEMTDAEFEALAAAMPKRTPEQVEADYEEWASHPLNCKEITPEMLDKPEFQALQNMAFEGTPVEVATNFKNHAYDHLGNLLLNRSKNQEKDFQESLYCFDCAIEQKCGDEKLEFDLLVGRAKLNMLRAQFGKSKDDCLEAIKRKDNDEQCWFILARSRFFVEKYEDCMKYLKQGLNKVPKSAKLLDLKAKCEEKLQAEIKRVQQVELIHKGNMDKQLEVYRALRAKGVKIGKKNHELPEIVDSQITLDKKGRLHFPVLIVYDEFMVTDFIQDMEETERLSLQLRPIFNEQAPWDQEGIYRMDTIEVYFEADQTKPLDPKDAPKRKSNKKYIKVGLNQTLLDVLQHENHIVPQYPVLKIISKENDDFRDMFLGEI